MIRCSGLPANLFYGTGIPACIILIDKEDAQERKESAGKDPMGLAATALYLSCVYNGVSITQRDLAEAAGVTEVTIRNRYKGLKEGIAKLES